MKLDRYKLDRIVRIRPTHQATQWNGMDDGGNNMSYSGRAFVRWRCSKEREINFAVSFGLLYFQDPPKE